MGLNVLRVPEKLLPVTFRISAEPVGNFSEVWAVVLPNFSELCLGHKVCDCCTFLTSQNFPLQICQLLRSCPQVLRTFSPGSQNFPRGPSPPSLSHLSPVISPLVCNRLLPRPLSPRSQCWQPFRKLRSPKFQSWRFSKFQC